MYPPRERLHALVVAQDLRRRGRGHGRHEQRVPQPVLRHLRLQTRPVVTVRGLHPPEVKLQETLGCRGARIGLVRPELARELLRRGMVQHGRWRASSLLCGE